MGKSKELGDGQVFIWSDLHLGHRNILKFTGAFWQGDTIEEHDDWLESSYHEVVTRKDQLAIFLGDVAFTEAGLGRIGGWMGRKHLVRGNHDVLKEALYRSVFSRIYGLHQKRGHWLTHAPLHPEQLRGQRNIHGHCHQKSLRDNPALADGRPAYVNVCIESTGGRPIDLRRIVDGDFVPLF